MSLRFPQPLDSGLPVRRDALFRRLLALSDVLAATCGLAVIGWSTGRGILAASVASIPLMVLLAKVLGRYDRDEVVLHKSTLDEVPALLALAAAYALTWSGVAFLAGVRMNLRGGGVFLLWASTSVSLILLRFGARQLAQLLAPKERVLIVGDGDGPERLAQSLACDPRARIEFAGLLPLGDEPRVDGHAHPRAPGLPHTFADLVPLVRELDIHRVFIIAASTDADTMCAAVQRTMGVGVKVSIVPRLLEVVGSSVEFEVVGGVTVLGVRRAGLSHSSRIIKRSSDIIGATLGMLILSPAVSLVALAIKLDSPGPVFFRQRRVGRGGEPFEMLKFRSMVDDAEMQRAALQPANESDGLFKLSADPRITAVGRLLRRTSLDELPQLVNVLRGDMSLVGPRPLVLDEDRLIEGHHRERLRLAPGMTGPWQVLGPRRPPLSEMVKIDYLYVMNWSVWSDLKILLRTAAHTVARRGL